VLPADDTRPGRRDAPGQQQVNDHYQRQATDQPHKEAPKMRKTIITITAAAAIAALAITVTATASTTTKTEKLSFIDTSNSSQVYSVIATGAFTDGGSILIKSGSMPLSRGTIHSSSHFNGPPQATTNNKTCLMTTHATGTYKLSSGTGAYQGINGSGNFTYSARQVYPRVAGKCSFSKTPVGSQQIITGSGPVSLP
jgi:hypothetical protein